MNKNSITTSDWLSIDESYSITQCSNGYMLETSGRNKNDEYVNKNHLVLKHDDLVDALIEVDQAIKKQRSV